MKLSHLHETQAVQRHMDFGGPKVDLWSLGPKHGLRCPKCGAPEVNPINPKTIFIRGFKVDDWSQCLVCSGYYDPRTLEITPETHDGKKGWFR